jgi:nicotinamidase-related amidase
MAVEEVLIVVDMQAGLHDGHPKYELEAVINRINLLGDIVRRAGKVIWIRHCGKASDGFEPHTPGWAFLPELRRRPDDLVIEKTLNDAFAGTSLHTTLRSLGAVRVLIAGWATDFCVDATVRSAVSHDYHVTIVSDGHTVSDRPHLTARDVIRHHNWVWAGLLTNRSISVMETADLAHQLIA